MINICGTERTKLDYNRAASAVSSTELHGPSKSSTHSFISAKREDSPTCQTQLRTIPNRAYLEYFKDKKNIE